MEAGRAKRRSTAWALPACFVALVVVGAACSPSTPEPSVAVVTADPNATLGPLFPPTPTPAASTIPNIRPLASSGAIALARSDGSLWMVDAHGQATRLADGSNGVYGLPAWSPDGSQVAVIRTTSTDTSIVVIDTGRATAGSPASPRVIFQKAGIGPFYLSWHPDGRSVSFLADENGGLSLRIAPADGSSPDGDDPGAVIGTGSPFYFDWIGPDRLLAHVGTGTDALLGEIGIDGKPVAPGFPSPGIFRSPDMSPDGKYVGYVRAGKTGTDAVVVATRDGKSEHSMPVFGLAAVDFSPTGDALAAIGGIAPADSLGIPVGPLRVIDAVSGDVRTLLDGQVVSFAWSPDAKTVAAIRIVPVGDGTTTASASPAPSASPSGSIEVHLVFIDVATGTIRSDPEIVPAQRYTNGVLTYFDQYALSHRLWSPDSSSLLVPEVDAAGTTTVDVFFPDGGDPIPLDGDIGFWSP